MRRVLLISAGVLLIVLLLAAWLDPRDAVSRIPSVDNHGPRGLAVLATWLEGTGVEVRTQQAPLTTLADDVRTVVIAAPSRAELTAAEVLRLRRFVSEGGTLIYLSPRDARQPELDRWLGVHPGETSPLSPDSSVGDMTGTTVDVVYPVGLLQGVQRLRLSAERMVQVDDAIPMTTHGALWWRREARGEVWIGRGADLAESARLELFDNARFWANAGARGPMLFDEVHHRPDATTLPVNLIAAAMQLLVLGLVLLWARVPRLGPARDPAPSSLPSAMAYVSAFARLLARSGSRGELCEATRADFRRELEARWGLPATLSWHEVAHELEHRTGLPGGELSALERSEDLTALSRAIAQRTRALMQGPPT